MILEGVELIHPLCFMLFARKVGVMATYVSIPDFGKKKTGKVNHERVKIGDEVFDSLAEKDRYLELIVMQRAGVISDLKCHPRFEIIPRQNDERGKMIFQAAHYTADFSYMRDGVYHVEDVKSTYTREAKDYILRRKLMLLTNGIYVEEVVR